MNEFAAALRLSREKGVGASCFRRLLDRHSLPTLAYQAWLCEKDNNDSLSSVSKKKSSTEDLVKIALSKIESGDMLGYYYGQSGYPQQLRELGEPPPVIFASSGLLSAKYAAVVGARKILPEAIDPTIALVRHLIAAGYVIVSGGAAGVDALAHQTALEAGQPTLAVLANGIDVIYPACNEELFVKIKQNGALISELMPGARPMRSFFPTRNRLIAALADVVAVVQADAGSGALITADWAARLGKQIVTIAPKTNQPGAWAGNVRLIEAGACVF